MKIRRGRLREMKVKVRKVPVECMYCRLIIGYEELPESAGNIIWSICEECRKSPLRRMRYLRGDC